MSTSSHPAEPATTLTIRIKIFYRLLGLLRPKLGNLHQYKPRALKVVALPQPTQLTDFPKISIVTPSFQQGAFIEKTLQSVLIQAYPNLEYFVQDGGSQDNTTEILKRYQGTLSGWKSEHDNGQSHAINLGLARTSGEIMAWLNSDDLLLPGTLAYVADYFNKHPDVDVIYGNRLIIDEQGMEIGRWILPGHDGKVLSWVDYIPQETLFWRRRIWEKAGNKIDESFQFAMDWDLLLRFREAGAKFTHLPFFIGAFRVHKEQKTSSEMSTTGLLEINRIRERVLRQLPTHHAICKAVLPFMIRHMAAEITYQIKRIFYRGASKEISPNHKLLSE